MKILKSFKNQSFGTMLGASIFIHSSLVAATAIHFYFAPQFALEQAPSSMEVFIVKKNNKDKEREVLSKKILTAIQDAKIAIPLPEKKKIQENKVEQSLYVPPVKGADYAEAKPDYLKNPAPVYPEYAREHGWEGIVILNVLVNKQGSPEQVLIEKSSGYKLLDQSAVKTVQKWKFLPTRVAQLSFDSWVKIPVRFLLTEE